MTRVIGPPRSRRRRGTFLCCLAAALSVGLIFISGAAAVHDLTFQLDGDTSTACGTVPSCATQTLDWNSLFNADGTNTSVVGSGAFTNAAFVRDFGLKVNNTTDKCSLTSTDSTKPFCTADSSTFATGSKDTLNPNSGWQCNTDNNVNSKIDIMNGYSALYTDPGSGDKIIYFGLDKNKDNGNNNVGFWFLQGNASCSTASGTGTFVGDHHDGDILITSAFTSGGGVSSILAFRWAGGANGCIDSHDNPDPKTGCDGLQIGSGGDCKTASSTGTHPVDSICATTNSGADAFTGNITTKWLTADATLGVGNTVVPPNFFEGAIDITKEFQQAGGTVPSCFNTFLADTRSSQSPTATLFDYTLGVLGQCKTTLSTQAGLSTPPKTGEVASPTSIGSGVVSSGTDTANLTVTGTNNWTGTLTWYLCGPVPTATTTCDQTKGLLVTTQNNVTANGSYVSGDASLTSAGKYCWSAHFEPSQASKDAGVGVGNDDGTNECFTVAPVTPALTTCSGTYDTSTPPVCTPPSAAVAFGSAITDRASLTGLAKEPGSVGPDSNYPTINPTVAGSYAGSIQFTVKGPSTTGCGVTAPSSTGNSNPQTVNVDTTVGNKVYGPVSYTPGTPGTYHWQATLSNSSSVNNSLPVSENNANCTDTNEDVTVQQISTAIVTKQSWFPNDTAAIISQNAGDNLGAGGTVDFTLYSGNNCGKVTGTAQYTERQTLTGGSHQEAVSTHNYTGSTAQTPGGATVTPFSITTLYGDPAASSTGSYSWKVVYTPAAADTAHTGTSSFCTAGGTETFATTYTNDNSGSSFENPSLP